MDFLHDEIKNKAIKICTGELAWNYSDIVSIMKMLYKNEFVILGGDVINNDLSYTYDNWYYDYNYSLSYEENVKLGFNRSIEYVRNYHVKFGDMFYYVIVYMDKGTVLPS